MRYDYSIAILEDRVRELSKDYQRVLDLNRNSALIPENKNALEAIKNRMVGIENTVHLLKEINQ